MISKPTLLSSILLASVALAIPSFARDHEERESRYINHVSSRADAVSDRLYAPEREWAGLTLDGQNMFMISGTVTIPRMDAQPGSSAMGVWFILGAYDTYFVRLGFYLGYNDGVPHFKAYFWANTSANLNGTMLTRIPGFLVGPSDKINVMLYTCATATQTVSLYLYNRDQKTAAFNHYLRVGPSFSPKSVGWVVEAKEGLSLPIFHNVTFEAIDFDFDGANEPVPYDIFNIQNVNGANLTFTNITDGGKTLDIFDLNSHY